MFGLLLFSWFLVSVRHQRPATSSWRTGAFGTGCSSSGGGGGGGSCVGASSRGSAGLSSSISSRGDINHRRVPAVIAASAAAVEQCDPHNERGGSSAGVLSSVSGTLRQQMIRQKVALTDGPVGRRPLTRHRAENMIAFVLSRTFKWSFMRAKRRVGTRVQTLRAAGLTKPFPLRPSALIHGNE